MKNQSEVIPIGLVVMRLRNGELGNLFPLGKLLFALMALPGMLLAFLGARFGRRP